MKKEETQVAIAVELMAMGGNKDRLYFACYEEDGEVVYGQYPIEWLRDMLPGYIWYAAGNPEEEKDVKIAEERVKAKLQHTANMETE